MAAAEPAPPRGADRPVRARSPSSTVVITVVAVVVGVATRAVLARGARPLRWNDSAEYLESADAPLFSLERLAGPRPILTPLLVSAAQRELGAFVDLQIAFAALAWGLLAGAVAAQLGPAWGRWSAAGLVLGMSLMWPVTMWDQQVLSESSALSALALFVAGGLWFWSRPGPWTAAALLAGATLWLFSRDSHVVPVAIVGTAVLIASVRAAAPRRRLLATTGAYLVALAFLTASMATHGHRGDRPLEHVFAVRVLPFADRVAWFSDQGMPDGAALQALPESVDTDHDLAPFTPVPPDPRWDEWRAWLATSGRSALVRYVATHPSYLVAEPTAEPERVFNNRGGIEGYRPLELRTIPGLATVFHLPTPLALVVAVGAAAVLVVRRDPFGPLALVGGMLVLSALPHGAVVWHSDGMESARHLLIAGVQLRLGTLLLVLAAVAATGSPRGTGPSPPARWPDRPRARPLRGC